MADGSFKSIEEIKAFLIEVFDNFSEDVLHNRNSVFNALGMIRPLSTEFCSSIQDGELAIGDLIGEGGNGVVAPLHEVYGPGNEKQVWAQYNSFAMNGSWSIGYARVIAKRNKGDNVDMRTWFEGNTLYSPDFIHESIVQALVTNLYTSSITPHVVNLFATYLCGTDSYNLIEQSDYSLINVLYSGTPDQIREIFTVKNMVIWTIQIAWTMYCMKLHYNITHEDMHFGNLLITDLATQQNAFVFGGRNILQSRWIRYVVDSDNSFYLPVTRFFLKIADYGYTECTIPINNELQLTLKNTNPRKVYQYDTLVAHPELFNALEVNYVIRMFSVYCAYLSTVRNMPDFVQKLDDYTRFAKTVDSSLEFTKHLYNVFPPSYAFDGQQRTPYSDLESIRGEENGFIRYRGWGTPYQSMQQPLYNLTQAAQRLSTVSGIARSTRNGTDITIIEPGEVPTPANTIICTSNPTPFFRSYVQQYLHAVSNLYDCEHTLQIQAIINGDPIPSCVQQQTQMIVLDPNSYEPPQLVKSTVKAGSPLVTRDMELVTDIEVPNMLEQYAVGEGVFTVSFQPYTMGPEFLNTMSYFNYQRDLLGNVPTNAGRPIEQVTLHIVVPPQDISLVVNQKRSIIDQFRFSGGRPYLANGGYFIVDTNLNNQFTKFLTASDSSSPIGYFCSDGIGQTILPIPLPYESDFGVIVELADGGMRMVPYPYFVRLHNTTQVDMLYRTESGILFVVAQRQIKTDRNGKPSLKTDGRARIFENYRNAFCTGPLLYRDGRIQFTREKMLSEEMVLTEDTPATNTRSTLEQVIERFKLPDGTPVELKPLPNLIGQRYRVSDSQQNNLKFSFNLREAQDMYGQRASNKLHINAALCEMTSGQWVWVLCEGRGYYAPGIDRFQFAWLLSHFDFRSAISIDGGFSAQVLYYDTDASKLRFILYSPDTQRKLGSIMEAGASRGSGSPMSDIAP